MHLSFKAVLLTLAASLLPLAAYAQSSSPFAPPEEKLGTYVVNSGPGLDTGCSYRSDGPLIIHITIPKVVNDTQLDADGKLKDAAKLIANGVLSAQFTLRFPVYDIDDKANTGGSFEPEVDRISFNGKFQGTLRGFDSTWTDDTIAIPIEELKFGQPNEIRIDIDTANTAEFWCMAVDWVAVEFRATPPYILQHGIAADASTWNEGSARGVISALQERGVLFRRFSLGVPLKGNGRAADNALQLQDEITAFLEPLKAKQVHVIAHSKGGLDTQALQAIGPEFEILSLSTLSTPHLGSVAADMSLVQQLAADEKINTGHDPNGFASTYINAMTFGQGPRLPGLRDLTTAAATTALASGVRGNIPNTYTFGADADLNGDNDLSAPESEPLFDICAVCPVSAHYAAARAWRVLRDFAAVPMSLTTVPGHYWGTRTVLTYHTVMTPSPQRNDIVVTLRSAHPGYGTSVSDSMANHSTVKSAANVNRILDLTIPLN